MSIKIGMTSKGVDEQISVLREFPEIADKHYQPAIRRNVSRLKAIIQPDIPTMSGRAKSTFGSKVTGRGFRIKGQVGWYDSNDPWYINVVEHGAEAHDIPLKPKKAGGVLAWNGGFSRGHTVRHPGMSARGFMMAGYSSIQPLVEAELAMANERILADLAAIGSGP